MHCFIKWCIHQGFPMKQNQYEVYVASRWCNLYTHIIYYKELVNATMEAENSQDLLLASWRPKRADSELHAGS